MGKQLAVLFLFMVVIAQAQAQRVTGKVTDAKSGQPVIAATIACRVGLTFTDTSGRFTLQGLHPGDSLSISCVGYKRLVVFVNIAAYSEGLLIRLEPMSVVLSQVSISALRDHRADSLRNRKEFAKAFNYQAPKLKDIFISRANTAYAPGMYNSSANSTGQLVSVDVLAVIALLGKNKAPESRLQKTLIQEEETTYVDRIFSKQRVMEVTTLKGDSLKDFMTAYRPGIQQLKKMTSYDVIIYIKKSYADFAKNYHGQVSPFKD